MPDQAGAALAPGEVGFGTPFAEQLAFFRRKLNLPTDRWDDIMNAAHDRAFIVAGAARADLLQDLRQAVDTSMAAGESVGAFRTRFRAVVAKNGWTGWTGEGSAKGEAWRAGVIYDTNLSTSYAAGRWRQLTDPAVARELPFWRYRHADGVLHPRPLHVAWDGLTLPQGHSFWKQHFPPNGWGCHCKVFAQKAPAPGAATEPPAGWDQVDQATGAQVGIDRGFGYAPGARATEPLQAMVDAKLLRLDAPIGAAMWQAMQPTLAMERQQQWWDTLDAWLADPLPRGRSQVVGTLSPDVVAALEGDSQPPANAAINVSDRLVVGAKQRRHEADQNALTVSDWRALTTLLDTPGAVYRDTADATLVYVADGAGPMKAAVRYDQAQGAVVSAFRVAAADVAGNIKGGAWAPL